MPAEQARFGYWRDPVFLVCLASYAINRVIIKPSLTHYSDFFHGHFNDSLTVPVALPIYLYVYRLIGFRPDDAPPRWWEIALHTVVWIVFFEWFGPVVLHHGTYDPLDNWYMAGGALISWALWKIWFYKK